MWAAVKKGYDLCACGRQKRTKNNRCAECRGYGTYRWLRSDGYVRIFEPSHPLANADGQVLEHRKVLYDAGVEIPEGFQTHHINGDRADNRLENLVVKSASDHSRDHAREAGVITNQYGTFPLHTPESRRAMWRENQRRLRERRRALTDPEGSE